MSYCWASTKTRAPVGNAAWITAAYSACRLLLRRLLCDFEQNLSALPICSLCLYVSQHLGIVIRLVTLVIVSTEMLLGIQHIKHIVG